MLAARIVGCLRHVRAGGVWSTARLASRVQCYSTALDKLPMSVYYGSQSGTAQMLAHLFTQEADQQDIKAEVFDLDEFSGEEFMKEQVIVLIMATFGEGEVTDNARKFYDWLTSPARTPDEFSKAKILLFGLGNSRAYAERYQKATKDVEKRLSELNVVLELPRGEGDDAGEIEDDFDAWKERVWARLHGQAEADEEAGTSTKPEITEDNLAPVPAIPIIMHDGKGIDWRAADRLDNPIPRVVDHKNPVPCKVMVNEELCNPAKTGRSARHIEIDIKGRLTYQTGDHVGVYPLNDPDLVKWFCEHMGYDLDAAFSYPEDCMCQGRKALSDNVVSVREALYRLLDIQALPGRVTVETLARFATDPTERAELFAMSRPTNKELFREKIANEYIGVAELCLRYPSVKVPLGNMLEMLPRLQSRFYSISSSSSVHPGMLHMSVSVVNTPLQNGKFFKGLCSNFIKRTGPGSDTDTMRLFVRQSLFRMPPDPSNQPMIMIAAGAGFAPLRAFLQERAYLKSQGVSLAPAHLYFGTTAPDQDFIYADELKEYKQSGVLDYFHPSFCDVPGSSGEKFVQHFMTRKEDMALLSEQLAAGGRIYVCGRANTVGVGVDDAFVQILEKHPIPGMGNLTAKEYLLSMRHDYRYNLDVFAE